MTPTQPVTLARLSELLSTIDASTDVLRTYVQQEQTKHDHDDSVACSSCVADTLGLPFHADPAVARQAAVLRIACERLAQFVTPPRHLVLEAASSFYTTLALKITLKSGIPTLIDQVSKETKHEGVHVDMLSKKSRLDADLLARLLRHLTVSGIFQEIAPNTFSNTIASSTMVDSPEFSAYLDLLSHEGQIAAPFFPDLITQRFAASHDHVSSEFDEHTLQPLSAFALYSHGEPFYSWIHSPAHADRGKNFNLAMRGMGHTEGHAFLPFDYPFSALPSDTLIVDVGGGIGSLPELLLPSAPHLRFLVQDLAPVVAQAQDAASPNMKRWITEGRIRFEVQDCFSPQTAQQGAVFLLKSVIHNYPDSKALQLLAAIRPSNPSKLLIIDRMIVPHLRTQALTPSEESAIYRKLRGGTTTANGYNPNGSSATQGPDLPATSQSIPTIYDLIMASLHGGRTRTLEEWRTLLLRSGFHLDNFYPLRASTGQAVLEATII